MKSITIVTSLITALLIGQSVHGFNFKLDFDNNGTALTPKNKKNFGDGFRDWEFNDEPMVFKKNIGGLDWVSINAKIPEGLSGKPGLFDSSGSIEGKYNDDDLQTPGDPAGAESFRTPGFGNTVDDWETKNYLFGDEDGAENILIVQQHNKTSAPDDHNGLASLFFTFSEAVTFDAFGIVDLENKGNNLPLKIYVNGDGTSKDGTLMGTWGQPGTPADNSYFEESGLGWTGVTRIEFRSTDSFAISGIQVVPEPGTVIGSLLGLGMVGYVGFRRRRASKAVAAN